MDQYSLRGATNSDEEVIFKLYGRVMKEYITEIWGWEQKWQENDFKEHFNPINITVVNDTHGAVGYSQVEDQGNKLYIRMLLLLPEHQRKGIGSRLLKAVIEKAKIQSKEIALQVFKINKEAKKFYEYHGFQAKDETPNSIDMVFSPNQANSADGKKRLR